ncbi:MAG: flagellar hook-associated protein FlgK [Kofleriaceae bacterium]
MSDLFSLLSLGSAGIAAQNTGISVASNNVANANTEGYSRQRVDLEALRGSPLVGGVRSGSPDRLADSLLGGRIRLASSSLAMSQTSAMATGDLESRINTGTSLGQDLAEMFASFGQAAATPTDPISRTAVVESMQQLVEGIRRRAAELAQMREEFNQSIREKLEKATELAERLAHGNLAVAKTNDPAMKDQRDLVAKQLSELVGGTARIDADGQMRFVLEGGAVLVDGKRAAKLEAGTDPVTGDTTIAVVDGTSKRDVSTSITGGSTGALIGVRDGALTQAQTDLDQFAFDLATTSNATHRAYAGLDGVSGRTVFTQPTGVAGAAAAFEVDPGIEADPSTLAFAVIGAGQGSNAGALELFGNATKKLATGGKTLGEAALDFTSRVGRAAAHANADVTRDELVSEHLATLQDSLSGVDLQEEMTNLSRFEHASSAMTKFVTTIDSLLGDLIDRL